MRYTFCVRIDINPSALRHDITITEIHTVINHPEIRYSLSPRIPNAVPVLFIGRGADNEPHIEVIADILDTDHTEAFHAMMLRPSLVAALGLDRFITPDCAPQRR